MAEYFNKFLSKNETILYPWDIIIQDDQTVKVVPGLVGDLLCENWASTFNVDSTSVTATYYAKIRLKTDGRDVLSGTILIDSTPPEYQKSEKNKISSSVEILFNVIKNRQSNNLFRGPISLVNTITATVPLIYSPLEGGIPYDFYYKLYSYSAFSQL
jgi:hypothetical protein